MAGNLTEMVALALFASDGMKFASRDTTLEQSWELQPEVHNQYRERALVFIKVMGSQMTGLADVEIDGLDAKKREGKFKEKSGRR